MQALVALVHQKVMVVIATSFELMIHLYCIKKFNSKDCYLWDGALKIAHAIYILVAYLIALSVTNFHNGLWCRIKASSHLDQKLSTQPIVPIKLQKNQKSISQASY